MEVNRDWGCQGLKWQEKAPVSTVNDDRNFEFWVNYSSTAECPVENSESTYLTNEGLK